MTIFSAASVTSSTSPPNLNSATTEVDDKVNVSSFLNELSSNSIVNAMVVSKKSFKFSFDALLKYQFQVFGLPMVTALMSLLGAGEHYYLLTFLHKNVASFSLII